MTNNTNTNTNTESSTAVDIAILMGEFGTKSNVIRHLSSEGYKRADIAKMMNIRYQHVRNVLVQPLKKTVEV